jgi:hypothetical protein
MGRKFFSFKIIRRSLKKIYKKKGDYVPYRHGQHNNPSAAATLKEDPNLLVLGCVSKDFLGPCIFYYYYYYYTEA